MTSSSQIPSNSSELQSPKQLLGCFVRDLTSTIRELNSSVLMMTQYIVNGVLTEDIRSALNTMALQPATDGSMASPMDAFVVVPASEKVPAVSTEPSTAAGPSASPDAADGNNRADSFNPANVHTPAHLHWYAVTVGRQPGIIQGFHHITPNTENIPRKLAIRCRDEAHARSIFDECLRDGLVKKIDLQIFETPISYDKWYATHT